jgi:hypothetical protein
MRKTWLAASLTAFGLWSCTENSPLPVDAATPTPVANHPPLGFPTPFPGSALQGSMITYGDSGLPATIPPAVAGQVWSTKGPGDYPGWVTISSSDEGTLIPPPLANTWTQVNFNVANTTFANSGSTTVPTVYLADFITGGADTARCVFQNRPGSVGTPYTLTEALHVIQFPVNNSAAGIAVTDGTKIETWQLTFLNGGVDMQFTHRNSATSFAANAYSVAWNIGQNARFWLRFQVTTLYRFVSYSSDGIDFIPSPQMQDAGVMPLCSSATLCYELNTTFINNAETAGGACINPESSAGSGVTIESFSFTSP